MNLVMHERSHLEMKWRSAFSADLSKHRHSRLMTMWVPSVSTQLAGRIGASAYDLPQCLS